MKNLESALLNAREGNRIIEQLMRDILALMTKAHNGGFFSEEGKLAVVYSYLKKAHGQSSKALLMLEKEVGL